MLKGWSDEIETEVIGSLQDHQPASAVPTISGDYLLVALARSVLCKAPLKFGASSWNGTSIRDLASGRRISKALALSYIGILARQGKVTKVTMDRLGIRDHSAPPISHDRDLKAAAL